jgi:two-component system nitrate/nitrite response regulator NarL
MEILVKNDDVRVITPTELEIVKMISDGMTVPEIAVARQCALKTIEVHMANVRKKIKCNTAAHVVATLLRKKIIE